MIIEYLPPEVLIFGLDGGVPLEPQNPYPFLRLILAEKGTHFFSKYSPIFHNFQEFTFSKWVLTADYCQFVFQNFQTLNVHAILIFCMKIAFIWVQTSLVLAQRFLR